MPTGFTEGFADLHTDIYRQVLTRRGFGFDDARPLIRRLTLILVFAGLTGIGGALAEGSEPSIVLERSELRFSAVVRGSAPTVISPEQAVLLDPNGADKLSFTASSNQPWLVVKPLSGIAPGRLIIGIRASAIAGPARSDSGEIIVTFGSGSASHQLLHVSLAILPKESRPPFGAFDAPAGEIVLGGATQLSGWALDDVAVTSVAICRDQAAGTPTTAACAGRTSRALVGMTTFGYGGLDGGRPDVMKLFQTPLNFRSAWSYVLDRGPLTGVGPGPFSIYAIALDSEGHTTILGKRTVRLQPEMASPPPIPFPLISVALMIACFALTQFWFRERLRHAPGTGPATVPAPIGHVHWAEWCFLALIAAGYTALELPAMRQGLQYDELYTASLLVVGRSLWTAASTVIVFNNHIAYSLLAGLAIRLFGASEWVLRAPSLAFGFMTIVVVWALARLVSNRYVALASAALLATCPFFVTWSHMARGYAGLTLMCLVSTYGFFVLLRRPSVRTAWYHGVATTLAVYFNLYGIWIVAVQYLLFAWLVLRPQKAEKRRDDVTLASLRLLWTSFSAVTGALVLLYSPVLEELIGVVVARGRTPLLVTFPREVYETFMATNSVILGIAIGVIALFGLVRHRRLEAAYFVLSLALPFVVMWEVLRPVDLYTRFFVFWTPMFAYLIACGVFTFVLWAGSHASRLARVVALGPAVGACVVIAFLMAGWIRQDRSPTPDGYRSLLQPAVHEAGWQSFGLGGNSEMFEYYLPKPFALLRSKEDLDRTMHEAPLFQVAYHDVGWNSSVERQMAEILRRRCSPHDHPPVTLFLCGQ